MTGRGIVIASWMTLGVYTLVAAPFSLGVDVFEVPAVVVSLTLFFASIIIWVYSFALALVRSTRGDDIVVSNWVFLNGSAPSDVRKHLLWATFASVVICVATAFANPFGVLVPMLQLGLAALWGARYGTFPARRTQPRPGIAKGARR